MIKGEIRQVWHADASDIIRAAAQSAAVDNEHTVLVTCRRRRKNLGAERNWDTPRRNHNKRGNAQKAASVVSWSVELYCFLRVDVWYG